MFFKMILGSALKFSSYDEDSNVCTSYFFGEKSTANIRGVFRTLSNIENGVFCQNS